MKPTTPPSVELTADEARILLAFRTMNAKAKNAALLAMDGWADLMPNRVQPTLRLVIGGAR